MKIEGLKAYVEKLEVAHYILSKSLHPETTGDGDLTRTQYILMRMLSERDRWTVTELAEVLEVKPSAVTVAVDRLYKKIMCGAIAVKQTAGLYILNYLKPAVGY